MQQEIQKGYKQTEVGVIPEDWEVKSIGEIGDIAVGRDLKIENFSIHQNEKFKYPVFSNTVSNQGLYGYYDFSEYFGDSLTIVGRGVGLGTAFCRSGGYGAIGRLIVLFPSKNTNAQFVTEYVNNRITVFSESGGIPQLTGVSLAKYRIPLPPTTKEQTAIAEALGGMDDLINNLEQLIEKKRLIKQGAMQQLLVPKEGWEMKRLGKMGKTYGGLSGKSKSDFENGSSPYITFMNVMNHPVIDTSNFSFVKIGNGESQNQALNGDLFFNGSSETPEELGLCSVLLKSISDLYLNSFCFGYRPHNKEELNPLYLAYFFRSNEGRKIFYSMAQGATRYNLSKSNFNSVEIELPPITEQTEIATILSDMDAEIEVLEKKLSKYKMLKLGMMQNLLTGKIRLI